jgi:hypothetical protein
MCLLLVMLVMLVMLVLLLLLLLMLVRLMVLVVVAAATGEMVVPTGPSELVIAAAAAVSTRTTMRSGASVPCI